MLLSNLAGRDQRIARHPKPARDDVPRSHAKAGDQDRLRWRWSLRKSVHHSLHHSAQRAAASGADDQGRLCGGDERRRRGSDAGVVIEDSCVQLERSAVTRNQRSRQVVGESFGVPGSRGPVEENQD